VLDSALAIIGVRRPEEARVMRIRNTMELTELDISEPCLAEKRCAEFTPVGAASAVRFDAGDNLPG
jgi:hypothetical protein